MAKGLEAQPKVVPCAFATALSTRLFGREPKPLANSETYLTRPGAASLCMHTSSHQRAPVTRISESTFELCQLCITASDTRRVYQTYYRTHRSCWMRWADQALIIRLASLGGIRFHRNPGTELPASTKDSFGISSKRHACHILSSGSSANVTTKFLCG
jgi:hypothetical protein